jgi:hypothetical protein
MCYGQCFLNRNLSLVDDKTPQAPAQKLSLETSYFVGSIFQVDFIVPASEIKFASAPQALYEFELRNAFFHPPC